MLPLYVSAETCLEDTGVASLSRLSRRQFVMIHRKSSYNNKEHSRNVEEKDWNHESVPARAASVQSDATYKMNETELWNNNS